MGIDGIRLDVVVREFGHTIHKQDMVKKKEVSMVAMLHDVDGRREDKRDISKTVKVNLNHQGHESKTRKKAERYIEQ